MQTSRPLSRRTFLERAAAGAALASVTGALHAADGPGAPRKRRAGRLRQGVCRGVFKGLPLDIDGICRAAAEAGA